MDNKQYEKYNEERNKIIKEFKKQKSKNTFIILGIALLVLALVVILGTTVINNIAIAIVVGIIVVIFSVIFLRMRIVTINVSMQKKLQFFEDGYEKY